MQQGSGVTSPAVIVYEKTTCSHCRELVELLQSRGVSFDRIDFHVEPLSQVEIRKLLEKAGIGPRDAIREKEPIYGELELADPELDDDRLIALMAEHPQLLQRPIVEFGERAVLARPAERVLQLLDEPT